MPQLASLLRVHAWLLVLQGLQSPAMAIVLKNLDLRLRVTMDLVRRVIEAGAIIALALWLRNVWALLLGQLVGMSVGSLLSFWVAPFRPRLSLYRPARNYFLRYGKQLNVTTLCIFGVMSGGELVIGRVLGQEALGLYQIALAIPLLLGVRATVLIHQISMPTYALLQRDRLGVARVFELQMGLVGLIFIPLAAGVAVLAPIIVPVAFGPQWLAIVSPLRMLCLYAVCAGYLSIMTALHYGANRPDLQMKIWGGQCLFLVSPALPSRSSSATRSEYCCKVSGPEPSSERQRMGHFGRLEEPVFLQGSLPELFSCCRGQNQLRRLPGCWFPPAWEDLDSMAAISGWWRFHE